jgi:hypothetical protein
MRPPTAGSDDVTRILEADGTPVGDTDVGLSAQRLRDALELLIRARRLDRECVALQRDGQLTVYPPFEGQEAAQVGSALALGDDDFVFPSFRELGVALARGVDVVDVVEAGGLALGEDLLVGVTLAVGPEQAARLAFASRAGLIDVVRVDGPLDDAHPATVRSGDFP